MSTKRKVAVFVMVISAIAFAIAINPQNLYWGNWIALLTIFVGGTVTFWTAYWLYASAQAQKTKAKNHSTNSPVRLKIIRNRGGETYKQYDDGSLVVSFIADCEVIGGSNQHK